MKLRFSRGARFLAYGLAGWAVDSLFVFAHTGRRRPSNLLNVPVYGLAQPLFEPVHDRIRQRPLMLRATLYSAGILAVEYTSGRLLRRLVGYVPWDYSRARLGIDELVRLDYLPLWAAYGLGLERLHDLLVTPSAAEEKEPEPSGKEPRPGASMSVAPPLCLSGSWTATRTNLSAALSAAANRARTAQRADAPCTSPPRHHREPAHDQIRRLERPAGRG